MIEKPRVFYCLSLLGDEDPQHEHCGNWFKEVDLPFAPPEGTTVWVYAVETGGIHCGPYFPVDVVGYEHWMRGNESEEDGHIRIILEFTEDDLQRNGGIDVVAEVLKFEGWEREPKL